MMFSRMEMWREGKKVADGVRFSDGSCALHWLGEVRSTAVYASDADLRKIHKHEGTTIYMVGDAWRRGHFEAHLDRNEGVHDFLQYSKGGPQKPTWIAPVDWDLYLLGYSQGLLDQKFRLPWEMP